MALWDVVSGHSVDGLGLDLMISLVFCKVNDSMILLQTLLDLGASPDYKDSRGLTPLYHSAMVGGDPYCCELLLHDYARLGCVDENGWQEIHQVRWIWVRSAGPGPALRCCRTQGAGGWWGLRGQQGLRFSSGVCRWGSALSHCSLALGLPQLPQGSALGSWVNT